MKAILLGLVVGGLSTATAQVIGKPFGFAKDVTGGGDAPISRPQTNEELIELLTSPDPQVVVIDKRFEFVGTKGQETVTGCAPFSTNPGCQLALDGPNWCGTNPPAQITYDVASAESIRIQSNKTLVGEGTEAVISGHGLHFQDVQNIIVQNIHITNLNPQYVWGGDALTLWGSDLVWIDHVRISLIGRQHITTGFNDNTRQTWSNMWFDGKTEWSAKCNGHHYWGFLLKGEGDQITFANNYITTMSGRSPSLGGGTIFHAVNSVWEDNPDHALEIHGVEANGLFEGCYFKDVPVVLGENLESSMFFATSEASVQCEAALGRSCQPNGFDNSEVVNITRGDCFAALSGVDIPPVMPAIEALAKIPLTAGNTLLKRSDNGTVEVPPVSSSPLPDASSVPLSSTVSVPETSELAISFTESSVTAQSSAALTAVSSESLATLSQAPVATEGPSCPAAKPKRFGHRHRKHHK